ncbi:MAG: Cyclin-dependent kinase-like 2, partial [Marteilia pararefringens]
MFINSYFKSLRHENVVSLLDVFRRRGRLYLVFEYIEFTLLDHMERKNGTGLTASACKRLIHQMIEALHYMHSRNVIHRDLKPENVLVSQEGLVKLCDLGFARSVANTSTLDTPVNSNAVLMTEYVATRWYRAPELLIGETCYGKPVDIWALGCIIPEMMTCQPLFPGSSDLDQLYQIVRCVGPLCRRHLDMVAGKNLSSSQPLAMNKNSKWLRILAISRRDKYSLGRRFRSTPASQHFMTLTAECLEMDPDKRVNVSQLAAK